MDFALLRARALLRIHPTRRRLAERVRRSGLFDPLFYRGHDEALGAIPDDALFAHYVAAGARKGSDPHPLFDTSYYLDRYPDVGASRLDPLSHYIAHGAAEERDPHPLFNTSFYFARQPAARVEVAALGVTPLEHFLERGWRLGYDPHPLFDTTFYVANGPDLKGSGENPLVHYLRRGAAEGRAPGEWFDPERYLRDHPEARGAANLLVHHERHVRDRGHPVRIAICDLTPAARLRPSGASAGQGRGGSRLETIRTIICCTHVLPLPARAGNEYRLLRLLRWLKGQGHAVALVIAPLAYQKVTRCQVLDLAAELDDVIVCRHDGAIWCAGRQAAALRSLDGSPVDRVGTLLGEREGDERARWLLETERMFCHDVLIHVVRHLQAVVGRSVVLVQYVFMTRLLQLLTPEAFTIVDTVDVFSSKREKVLRYGVEEWALDAGEEAERLRRADAVIAIQQGEAALLQRLVPDRPVITAGIDFDVVDPGARAGHAVLFVGSDNPMNRRGIGDFLESCWSRVVAEVPDAELVIAGRVGEGLGGSLTRTRVVGPVQDLDAAYGQARVVINPCVAGTGIKVKTLEALAHLRPVVSWPAGVDGIDPSLASLCCVVDSWEAFTDGVVRELTTPGSAIDSSETRGTIAALLGSARTYSDLAELLRRA